jgi:hypothetical protein
MTGVVTIRFVCMYYVRMYVRSNLFRTPYGVPDYRRSYTINLEGSRKMLWAAPHFFCLLSLAIMTHGQLPDSWVNLNEMDYVCIDMQYDS